ncbi:DUF2726 domain-containing protein [Ruminococcus flavefaciens]|uniref:DUF2726 domain-containing protein n=1 Tax=Ruminococcus flavefaciens TaxID=1265 RepID=UPI000466249C|nr:DUF2726 domain-containing protein [Ruminococcus flavefaciens]
MDKTLLTVIIIGIIVLILSRRPKTFDTPVKKQEEIEKTKNNEEIQKKEDMQNDEETPDNFFPYKKKYILTKNEYYFYNNLKEIIAPLNLQILAKIRLADLIEVDTNKAGKEFMKYFGKIKSKHIDFAIVDNMKVIMLLELDDNSHNKEDRKERDSFVNNALLTVGYTVVRTNGNLDIIKKALIDKGYHENLYQNTQ